MEKLELSEAAIHGFFPKRTKDSHEFTNGYVTVVAGSIQFPGAARLAAHAAARVGAGGVITLIPESIRHTSAGFYPEIIVWELKEYHGQFTYASAFERFNVAQERSQVVLIGCGMGREDETYYFIKECLLHTQKLCVLDADALYALAILGEKFIIEQAQGNWVLTPHAGEWKRLLDAFGYTVGQNTAQELAMKWNCTIVLKGFPTVTYLPNGQLFANLTGNPAATTAGCGDVLAGIIAGLAAQEKSVEKAALSGVYLAGKVADDYVLDINGHSLLASDIIERLPLTLGRISVATFK